MRVVLLKPWPAAFVALAVQGFFWGLGGSRVPLKGLGFRLQRLRFRVPLKEDLQDLLALHSWRR